MKKNRHIKEESSVIWLIPKANIILRKEFQKKLSKYDILYEQWFTLSRIYRNEGSNQKKIAELSYRNEGAVTRTINVFEKKEILQRVKSENDKREYLIYLTEKGRKLYLESEKEYYNLLEKIKTKFSEKEIKEFKILLNKFIENK